MSAPIVVTATEVRKRMKDRALEWDAWFSGLSFDEQMLSLALIQKAQERALESNATAMEVICKN